MDKTQRIELGDRIFCENWKDLLATGLILTSEGYGVNIISRKDMMNDVLTITALPEEKNDQIPDTRVTIKEAAEELQNLAKAGISQEPCDTCGYEEGSIYCKEHCPHEVKIEQEPCSTISKQAVDTLIDELARAICDERGCISRGRSTASIMQDIRNLPPVTPQPKTGRWVAYEVRLPDRTILNYRCSVCGRKLIGYSTETLSEAPFCHCGAKMVEPQKSEERSGEE